jgi:PAS domain-containing protein
MYNYSGYPMSILSDDRPEGLYSDMDRDSYYQLFDNVGTGVAVYTAVRDGEDFIIRDFNRAAETIERINREDVVGRSVLEVFPGVVEAGIFEVFQRVWRTGKGEHHHIANYHDERISGWRKNYVYKLGTGEVVAAYEDKAEYGKVLDVLSESQENNQQGYEKLQAAFMGSVNALAAISEKRDPYTAGH